MKTRLMIMKMTYNKVYLAYDTIIKYPICGNVKFLAITHQWIPCSEKVVDCTLHPDGRKKMLTSFQVWYIAFLE